jgi:DNA-binding transcriptional MerR regulator
MDDELMQIGQVATRIGLSLRTIRYYDEMDVITPSARSPGGFRLYTKFDVQRLALVKKLKPLEFSLDQIRQLLSVIEALEHDPGDDEERTADLHGRLAMFRTAVDSRVDTLRAQLDTLEALSEELKTLSRTTHHENRLFRSPDPSQRSRNPHG